MKNYLDKIKKFLDSEIDPAFARRARIIFENLDLGGSEKILEIGCGRGFYLNVLSKASPKLDVTGIDLNEKYLSVAKDFINDNKVKLIKADATKLPFKDKSFDRIIATEILEHIPNDEEVISEINRVLKPGGIVMVTVPNKNYPFFWDPINWVLEKLFNWHLPSNIWWLSGIWADHVRLYDTNELKRKLEQKGFKVEKVWQATHYCFPFSHFLFYGIGKNLVEKGLFPNFNRFSCSSSSLFSKIILAPIKMIDRFNNFVFDKLSSVNLIVKATKRK